MKPFLNVRAVHELQQGYVQGDATLLHDISYPQVPLGIAMQLGFDQVKQMTYTLCMLQL